MQNEVRTRLKKKMTCKGIIGKGIIHNKVPVDKKGYYGYRGKRVLLVC